MKIRRTQAGRLAGPVASAAVVIALVVAACIEPPLAAAVLVIPFIPLYLRHLPVAALALLTGAPLLLSSFTVGSLTLDNLVTFVGIASALLWAIQTRRFSLPVLSVFPILIAIAIAISGVYAGVASVPGVVRFVGLAFVPALVLSGAVSRQAAERVIYVGLVIGALSVITQPIDPYVAPYIDPQTGAQRYGGLMGHPNFAAYAIGLGILYLLNKGRLRAWQWSLIGLFAVAILMTSSIGALATVAAAALVILFRRGVLRALAVIAAGLIGVVAVGDTLIGRIDALTGGNQNLNSVNWRFEQWAQAIAISPEQWFTGIGWQQVPNRIPDGLEAHSAYVEIWVELGLLGSILAVIGALVLLNSAWPRLLPMLLMIVVLISSITDPVIVYPSSLATLLTLLACERVGAGLAGRLKDAVEEQQVSATPAVAVVQSVG
ncbi:O-antigen ligase family protein [Amnibacterium kyonggiense]